MKNFSRSWSRFFRRWTSGGQVVAAKAVLLSSAFALGMIAF